MNLYRLFSVFLFTAAAFRTPLIGQDFPQAKIYPAPKAEPLSAAFSVSVAGHSVPVYPVKVARADQGRKEIAEGYCDTAAFAYFDLKTTATVSIRVPEAISQVTILPLSAMISYRVEKNRLTFVASSPGQLTIEINNQWVRSLHLFINPPERNPPHAGDPGVVFFGPGVHYVSHLDIRSNETLYIAGGAVVHAKLASNETRWSEKDDLPPTFALNGSNIHVRGRGIIDASLCPTHSRNIFLTTGRDISFEGIILKDPAAWFMPIRRSGNISVINLKLLGYRSNSDGIDIANCRNVLVKNCFIRSSDDLVVIKTDKGEGAAKHIVVERCVLWNQFAHALSIGAELREDIDDVLFDNCDIIHDKGREWAMRIFQCDSSIISNVRFRNIRITDGNRFISLWIGKTSWSMEKEGGNIRDIYFENITAAGHPMTVELTGYDSSHVIENIHFKNIRLNSIALRPADVRANRFVRPLAFED